MAPEKIIPANEADWLEKRRHDITSTEIAALFNCSPYMTKFELWHRKKNKTVVEFKENSRMKWGTALQNAIAEQVAKDLGFKVRRMDEYMRIPELRMGASFDFEILGLLESDSELFEIKNVDSLVYKQGWIEDEFGNIEAPPHIEIQVQHQLAVSGRFKARIGALVGGNDLKMINRIADEAVIKAIQVKCAEFWDSIDNNIEPKPDFGADSEFISKLYGFAEPGKLFNAKGNEQINSIMEKYKEASERAKIATEEKDAYKAEILTLVGDCEKVWGDFGSISMGIVGECPISYVRKPYRLFKPTFTKKKD